MKNVFFFLLIFSFSTICYAQQSSQSSTTKIQLTVRQINEAQDLNLLTYAILNNQKYVYSYIPIKYSQGLHLFELEIIPDMEEFFTFLRQPKTGFSLQQFFIDGDTIEFYFQSEPVQSYNHASFFEGSKLEESIEFLFDSSTDYALWKPDLLELENNNSFLSNNPIEVEVKLFATLNTRHDRDFYSIKTTNTKTLTINTNSFIVKEPIALNIYNEEFQLYQQFFLTPKQTLHQFRFPNLLNNNVIYLEFLNTNKKGAFAGSKNFNANYIFLMSYE